MDGYRAEPIDGRGGDGGIDVDVFLNDERIHIYQLKYFPEGFSGEWKKGREQQIQRSFDSAMKLKPEFWTLVLPRNPTIGERKFFRGLKKEHATKVDFMAQSQLDSEFAKHPDLERAFTREPLVDTLTQFSQEQAALVGPHDLTDRTRALIELANSTSPYYDFDISTSNGQVTRTLIVRDPVGAAKHQPIGINFEIAHLDSNADMRERLDRLLRFGSGGRVVINPESVNRFEITGPEWIAEETRNVELEISTPPLTDEERGKTEVRFIDENEITKGSFVGEIVGRGVGDEGLSMTTRFPGGLEIEFIIPKTGPKIATMTFSHEITGYPVHDVVRALHLRRRLFDGETAQIYLRGNQWIRTSDYPGYVRPMDDPDYADALQIADDLDRLGRAAGVEFEFPSEIAVIDRVDIRTARQMLDGEIAISPRPYKYGATLGISSGKPLPDDLTGISIIKSEGKFLMEFQGHKLSFGKLVVFHTSMSPTNVDEINDALEAGTAKGKRLKTMPTDGTPFRIYFPEFVDKTNSTLRPSPWGIANVGEMDGFSTLIEAIETNPPTEAIVKEIFD